MRQSSKSESRTQRDECLIYCPARTPRKPAVQLVTSAERTRGPAACTLAHSKAAAEDGIPISGTPCRSIRQTMITFRNHSAFLTLPRARLNRKTTACITTRVLADPRPSGVFPLLPTGVVPPKIRDGSLDQRRHFVGGA